MPNTIIDTMQEKDIDPILAIEQSAFKRPWSRKSFLNELTHQYSYNYVFKYKKSFETFRIVAYLCCRFIVDEIHILKIAVHSEYRQNGIATRLMHHCLDLSGQAHVHSAILEVRQSNSEGIGLYQKNGFEIEAQLSNYYSDTHEDLILMRKNFLKEA